MSNFIEVTCIKTGKTLVNLDVVSDIIVDSDGNTTISFLLFAQDDYVCIKVEETYEQIKQLTKPN